MKKFSTIWVLVTLAISVMFVPKTFLAAVAYVANLYFSIRCARKYNPSMFA